VGTTATLLEFHRGFAWVVVIGNGLAGLWALAAHFQPAVRSKLLWWFTIAAEVSIFVQVTLGVAAVSSLDIEAPKFHQFYGFVALITLAIIYSYRHQLAKQLYLLYAGGGLFLMGLGIRSMILHR